MAQKNLSNPKKVLRFLVKVLVSAGFFMVLLSIFLSVSHFNPNRLSFGNISLVKTQLAKNTAESDSRAMVPTHFKLEQADISVPIHPADIENGVWETTDRGVSYLVGSSLPGEQGNSIIYGHNWSDIFGNLSKVRPGMDLSIRFSDGSTRHFKVENTALVSPKNTAVLAQSEQPLLTIYTCAGLFDSQRFVVTARPVTTVADTLTPDNL